MIPFPSKTGRLSCPAALIAWFVSIALHTELWYAWQGMTVEPPPTPVPPLVVEAALVAAPTVKPQVAAPAPKPAPPPQEKPRPKLPEKAKPQLKPKPPVKPKPVAKPVQAKQAPSRPAPVVQQQVAAETAPSVPSAQTYSKPSPMSAQPSAPVQEPLVKAVYSAPGLKNPPTHYPRIAQMRQWEGTVILEIRVLADGSAGEVKIVHGSGHEVLDESAVEQVKSWRFIPAHKGDKTVDDWVRVPISFKFKR